MPSRRKRQTERKRERAGADVGPGSRGDRTPIPAPDPLQDSGIIGRGVRDPGRGNLRLIAQAIRQDWPVPDHLRPAIVQHLVGVLRHCRDERCLLSAARALLAADQPPRKKR